MNVSSVPEAALAPLDPDRQAVAAADRGTAGPPSVAMATNSPVTPDATMDAIAPDAPSAPAAVPQSLAALTLAAIGVVYGDIGTSPLYTIKEIFSPATGVALDAANLIGAISAIFWALMVVVTLKYVLLILRADNHGEGGGLALTALAVEAVGEKPAWRNRLLLLGVAGATLFYGDSVITPAISVVGAMEGLEVATPTLKPFIIPISLAILVGLFLVQRVGTARVGRWFGPIIVLWFAALAVSGIVQIAHQPAILAALNPWRAAEFLASRGWQVFAAVGAIVLAITGAEALYADMGHFGRRPIQLAWCGLVLPSLALNYLGQGALLMSDPSALENPFFRLFPSALLWPALALATLAAIIASQAVISGTYSMTQQAMQLGLLPRMSLRYTSASAVGQIYMPGVNLALLVGVVAATVAFGSSSALAGAYGIAVTLTMLITTVLTWFVVRHGWHLPLAVVLTATLGFALFDALLALSCMLKFADGGWFPLALGALLFVAMTTWWRGRAQLLRSLERDGLELEPFVASLAEHDMPRATRTAVYPVADALRVPQALLHNLKHNQVLHATNVVLTVGFQPVPWVSDERRVEAEALGHGFWRVTLNCGFMQKPDVPKALALAEAQGLAVPPMETSWFLSRETVLPASTRGMARWREKLFALMSRNAGSAADYFRLPTNAVIELGTRVQL